MACLASSWSMSSTVPRYTRRHNSGGLAVVALLARVAVLQVEVLAIWNSAPSSLANSSALIWSRRRSSTPGQRDVAAPLVLPGRGPTSEQPHGVHAHAHAHAMDLAHGVPDTDLDPTRAG